MASRAGWQHGPTPKPPRELLTATREAWDIWMRSWVAAHWDPGDLPQLELLVRLFDQVERGRMQLVGELRMWMTNYGLTPAGAQQRRWKPPETGAEPRTVSGRVRATYAHLRAIEDKDGDFGYLRGDKRNSSSDHDEPA
jgi:hypothetical protein